MSNQKPYIKRGINNKKTKRFENTKGVIRRRTSKEEKQHNDQGFKNTK